MPEKVYCVDCKYRWFEWLNAEFGKCSHPKHRRCRSYDYRQREKDLYPLCININRAGHCPEFEQRIKLRDLISSFFHGFRFGMSKNEDDEDINE